MLKVNQKTKRWFLCKGIHRFVFLYRSRKDYTERNGQGRSLFNETKKDDRFLHLIGSGHLFHLLAKQYERINQMV